MLGGGKLDISWFSLYYGENDKNEDLHILLRNAIILDTKKDIMMLKKFSEFSYETGIGCNGSWNG